MGFKASETAIVLIEFQNDFCKPGYPPYPSIEVVLKSYNLIENTVELVKKAKGKGHL